jgi:hypothetical protein
MICHHFGYIHKILKRNPASFKWDQKSPNKNEHKLDTTIFDRRKLLAQSLTNILGLRSWQVPKEREKGGLAGWARVLGFRCWTHFVFWKGLKAQTKPCLGSLGLAPCPKEWVAIGGRRRGWVGRVASHCIGSTRIAYYVSQDTTSVTNKRVRWVSDHRVKMKKFSLVSVP